jgi:hypothetical protein
MSVLPLSSPWTRRTDSTNVPDWSVVCTRHKGKKPDLLKACSIEYLEANHHEVLVRVYPFESESDAELFLFEVRQADKRSTASKIPLEHLLVEAGKLHNLYITTTQSMEP